MCDLSVLVEDYLSLAPAEKRELPHTLEECAMRVIIGMLPVLLWIVRTAREAAALTATGSALSAQEEQEGRSRGRRRKRAERSRIVHLVVWGSPSTGYWTALPFGDNQRQVCVHCQLLLLCAVCVWCRVVQAGTAVCLIMRTRSTQAAECQDHNFLLFLPPPPPPTAVQTDARHRVKQHWNHWLQ